MSRHLLGGKQHWFDSDAARTLKGGVRKLGSGVTMPCGIRARSRVNHRLNLAALHRDKPGFGVAGIE